MKNFYLRKNKNKTSYNINLARYFASTFRKFELLRREKC
ncbi:hypothetical protein CHY_1248 [Carboxydothermus hydrogenoformans Z-2901]|uniref:Uncharacterized protein n=1 Tax=Carboxydothermus hydrogenoformans (strain ATCC BAA-161 / DSM 6008 / Z-2901) TaxID=246194 RepID=Q3ACQ0_CARHZ|nr:hypothetical protein CHY_1248 [Carboxydothermus hydrogenoformans Z-2901]